MLFTIAPNLDQGVLYNKYKTILHAYPPGKSDNSFTIPDGITTIGKYSFFECTGLTSVTIPDSVSGIGDSAFNSCTSLTSLTIPNNVFYIGTSAFNNCTGLLSINVSSGNKAYSSENGVLYNKEKTMLYTYPAGKAAGSFTVPNSVTMIYDRAFNNCGNLTGVTISNKVFAIGEYAFYNCNGLTEITIPRSVSGIGEGAFLCKNLTGVTFQGRITGGNIGYYYDDEYDDFEEGFSPFYGDLKEKFFTGGIGTYITTAPVNDDSIWTKK